LEIDKILNLIESWSFDGGYPCVNSDVCLKVDLVFYYYHTSDVTQEEVSHVWTKITRKIDETTTIGLRGNFRRVHYVDHVTSTTDAASVHESTNGNSRLFTSIFLGTSNSTTPHFYWKDYKYLFYMRYNTIPIQNNWVIRVYKEATQDPYFWVKGEWD
jgi:hypothetical protein